MNVSLRRPRLVTEKRIVDAGIAITLPNVTVKSIAAQLGVSTVAVYNHVESADVLRRVVAEGIIDRHTPPAPAGRDLEEDILDLAFALRRFVHDYPGIGPYLAQIDATSQRGVARIDEVMTAYVRRHDLTPRYAAWLVSTVSEHAIALAELVHIRGGRPRNKPEAIAERADLTTLPAAVGTEAGLTPDDYFAWSIRAVIIGAITLLDTRPHPLPRRAGEGEAADRTRFAAPSGS
ncbi:TetR/AcrR family transcriptional regulator [Microbacterium sp.]|uniref:TetR/AcrR family transcriptional regulator n=1 Tax=Microbacterium sp. TaxID=51671 RepID=UPI003F9AC8D0